MRAHFVVTIGMVSAIAFVFLLLLAGLDSVSHGAGLVVKSVIRAAD